jgi:GxxExxY protein
MTENEIGKIIVDIAYKIWTKLGPGLLESVYDRIFEIELKKRGLRSTRETWLSVHWEGEEVERAYRADRIVEDKVLVELKAMEQTARVHKRQINSYIAITGLKLGFLLNFGAGTWEEVVTRVVNGLDEKAS